MKILLPTYRSISWIVPVYAHLHEKFWGDPNVVLLAEEDYSDGAFEFACPPDSVGKPVKGEIEPGSFSDVLIWYMQQIDDTFVIIMMADHLPYRKIDQARFDQLQAYMDAYPEILRGQVGDDSGFCRGKKTAQYKDIAIWEGEFLVTSLTPALWRRTLLLELLEERLNPWAIETRMCDKFYARGDLRSIAPSPGILCYVNALRGRDMSNIIVTEGIYEEVGPMLRIQPRGFQPERPWTKEPSKPSL